MKCYPFSCPRECDGSGSDRVDPRDRRVLACVHGAVHQILEIVADLQDRTTTLEEASRSLRCPSCGHSPMTVERLVDEKVGD